MLLFRNMLTYNHKQKKQTKRAEVIEQSSSPYEHGVRELELQREIEDSNSAGNIQLLFIKQTKSSTG